MRRSVSTIKNHTVHCSEYTGLGEAIETMEDSLRTGQSRLGETSLKIESGANPWSGTPTLNKAIEVARYGWEDGHSKLNRQLATIAIDALIGERIIAEMIPGFAGDEVDIDRYLLGDPENMLYNELRYDTSGKLATVYINVSQSAHVSPDSIIRRGASIIAAVEALKVHGYGLGITMVESCSGMSDSQMVVETSIPVIKPGEFIDTDSAAFCIAHPAFLRRLIFSLNEHESSDIRRVMGFIRDGGYGRPSRILSPIPENAFVIETDEGMGLSTDQEVSQFAQHIVNKTLSILNKKL